MSNLGCSLEDKDKIKAQVKEEVGERIKERIPGILDPVFPHGALHTPGGTYE